MQSMLFYITDRMGKHTKSKMNGLYLTAHIYFVKITRILMLKIAVQYKLLSKIIKKFTKILIVVQQKFWG